MLNFDLEAITETGIMLLPNVRGARDHLVVISPESRVRSGDRGNDVFIHDRKSGRLAQ